MVLGVGLLALSGQMAHAARKTAPVPGEGSYQDAMRAFKAGERARAKALFQVALADLPPENPLFAKTLYNLAYLADGDVADGEEGSSCGAQRAYERYLDALRPDDPEHTRTRTLAQTRRDALFDQCEAERAPVAIPVTTVESAPEPQPDWLLPAVAGGSAVALGTGVGMQIWAQSAIDMRDRAFKRYGQVADRGAAKREQDNARSAQADAEQRVLISYVAIGLGAVLAGTATWLWLTDASEAPPPAAVSVGPASLFVEGRW